MVRALRPSASMTASCANPMPSGCQYVGRRRGAAATVCRRQASGTARLDKAAVPTGPRDIRKEPRYRRRDGSARPQFAAAGIHRLVECSKRAAELPGLYPVSTRAVSVADKRGGAGRDSLFSTRLKACLKILFRQSSTAMGRFRIRDRPFGLGRGNGSSCPQAVIRDSRLA